MPSLVGLKAPACIRNAGCWRNYCGQPLPEGLCVDGRFCSALLVFLYAGRASDLHADQITFQFSGPVHEALETPLLPLEIFSLVHSPSIWMNY